MTAENRLTARLTEQQKPTRDLDQFVHEANQNWFVKDSGRPYFVNTKVNGDGTVTRFMDRHG